jgi:hypothetical protein
MQHFLILAVVLSSNAMAGVQGQWIGNGSLSTLEGASAQCSQMNVQIEASSKKLALSHGSFVCEGNALEWNPMSFEVRGTTLWREGLQVGSHFGNSLTLSFPMDSSTWIEVNATRENDRLTWSLKQRDSSSQTLFQAQLQKR